MKIHMPVSIGACLSLLFTLLMTGCSSPSLNTGVKFQSTAATPKVEPATPTTRPAPRRKPVAILPQPVIDAQPKQGKRPADIENFKIIGEKGKGGRQYTVKKGDTISEIARKFYGNKDGWRRIYDANKNIIKHPDKLAVGVVITIP